MEDATTDGTLQELPEESEGPNKKEASCWLHHTLIATLRTAVEGTAAIHLLGFILIYKMIYDN